MTESCISSLYIVYENTYIKLCYSITYNVCLYACTRIGVCLDLIIQVRVFTICM